MSSQQPPPRRTHGATAEELARRGWTPQSFGSTYSSSYVEPGVAAPMAPAAAVPGGATYSPALAPAASVLPPEASIAAAPAVHTTTTGTQWPQYVNHHRLIGALVAGFAATHIADMVGYWVRMFGFKIPPLDFATFNGVITGMAAKGNTQWWIGFLFHELNGIVFALGYALLVFPFLGKTLTTRLNLARSLPMGLILATLSLLWWMPANLPQTGIHPGFFSLNFGVETVLAVYFWHIVWALALGFFFNPQD